ncbi:MAG: PIG-L family deacetylase [Limisphaerales bacterium]
MQGGGGISGFKKEASLGLATRQQRPNRDAHLLTTRRGVNGLRCFEQRTMMRTIMKRLLRLVLVVALGFCATVHSHANSTVTPPKDGKLRIICFGAHPDDAELQAGGTAAMWAERGHHVKFVAMTNGDIGHWNEAGGPLAIRRKAEVEKAASILGVTVEVLDIHDGELMPTLENRKTVIRLIREWNADIVMSHRPNDYHPDHRYSGVLVQDAAFMVQVPFIVPDVKPLQHNPVFFYFPDRFRKPNPTKPDIAISIDSVINRKLDALAVMESQFLEGGALGHKGLMPRDEAHRKVRIREVRDGQSARFMSVANRFRPELIDWYGEEKGNQIQHAEAFELCEYGRQPSKEELKRLFPFFD